MKVRSIVTYQILLPDSKHYKKKTEKFHYSSLSVGFYVEIFIGKKLLHFIVLSLN